MKQSIVILTGSHLCHNPRVVKEASALADAGYDVEVFGGWIDPVLKARDQAMLANLRFRFRPVCDLTEQKVLRLGLRIRGRLAKIIHEKSGCETRWQLGYFVSGLDKAIRRSKADLLIAHSEQALWAIFHAGNRSARLGVDMEDWFSEDLPAEVRRHRPVKLLRSMEKTLLRKAGHTTCTSQAMSAALAKEYDCQPPAVVYNAFPWSDRATIDGQFKDRQNRELPSIHWYSQTLGMDRGLGDLFGALRIGNKEVEIHLRGKPVAGFKEWMFAQIPEARRKNIFIHELVSNAELLSRIAEHDIGFAGELRYCRNKEYTVSNKILHYLLGGLAVVASDTVGQAEIAAQAPGAVIIYSSGDRATLAGAFDSLLANRETLLGAKAAALTAAEKEFCWERQVPVLLRSVLSACL